jgi:F-type H+-transporting ATPase subunit a
MRGLLAAQGMPEIPNAVTLVRDFFANEHWAEVLSAWDDIIFSFVTAILLALLFYFASRKQEMIPFGLQNFMEWVVETFQTYVLGVLGPEGKKFVPFLGTLFIYILSMNLLGVIPLMKSPSSDLNVTLAMGICVFAYVQYLNIKHMGLKGFLYHLAGSPKDAVGWLVAPLMFPIELLTQISRPVTLALRLFGNIYGEKILLGFFAVIGITVLYFVPIQTPFVFLGVLTGVMQAMVFTLLSTIYILLSVSHTEENPH